MPRLANYVALLSLATSTLATGKDSVVSTAKTSREEKKTFKVPLDKQRVPIMSNGREVASKTAYYGTIHVGHPHPQEFTVVFDTGSGHVFLPSDACEDVSCRHHNVYKRNLSQSYVDVNLDGSPVNDPQEPRDMISISYGTGEILGDLVRETICLAKPSGDDESIHCAEVRMITAKTMTAEPFTHFEFDGVLGLGLNSLALDPELHFFGQMARDQHIEPIFSVFVSKDDAIQSEIIFGGSDESRFVGPMHWVPVFDPKQGFWKVWFHNIRVGNESVPFCDDGECSAIVDTGTSALGVPSEIMRTLIWKSAQNVPKHSASEIDCRNSPGPTISFEMAGGFTVELAPEDYMRPGPSEVPGSGGTGEESELFCRANLLPMDMPELGKNVFLWGAPILQKYYTSYDSVGERVGIAPVSHQSVHTAAKRTDENNEPDAQRVV